MSDVPQFFKVNACCEKYLKEKYARILICPWTLSVPRSSLLSLSVALKKCFSSRNWYVCRSISGHFFAKNEGCCLRYTYKSIIRTRYLLKRKASRSITTFSPLMLRWMSNSCSVSSRSVSSSYLMIFAANGFLVLASKQRFITEKRPLEKNQVSSMQVQRIILVLHLKNSVGTQQQTPEPSNNSYSNFTNCPIFQTNFPLWFNF